MTDLLPRWLLYTVCAVLSLCACLLLALCCILPVHSAWQGPAVLGFAATGFPGVLGAIVASVDKLGYVSVRSRERQCQRRTRRARRRTRWATYRATKEGRADLRDVDTADLL